MYPQTVHPRTRGEHDFPAIQAMAPAGSSPHTRGTSGPSVFGKLNFRFIPAHAGNISCPGSSDRSCPVHPRTRGEHDCTLSSVAGLSGSSPHTRGTSYIQEGAASRPRFIPAHAGNISRAASPARPFSVHPRTRGEHAAAPSTVPSVDGSSPHTRGT